MKISKFIGVLLLVTSGLPALASNWHFIATVTTDQSLFYFDADSVVKERESVLVWIKAVRMHTPDKDGAWASATRYKFNCKKRTRQYLSSSDYTQTGDFIKSYPQSGSEAEVVPDTVAEHFLSMSCAPDFPRSKSQKFYIKVPDNDIYAATRRVVLGERLRSDEAPK